MDYGGDGIARIGRRAGVAVLVAAAVVAALAFRLRLAGVGLPAPQTPPAPAVIGTPGPTLPRGVLYERLVECMFSGDPGAGCIAPFTRVELRAYAFGFRAPHRRTGSADAVPDSLCPSLVAEDPALRGSAVSPRACRSAFEDAAYDVSNASAKADALSKRAALGRAARYSASCRGALADGGRAGRVDAPRCNAAEFVSSVRDRRRPVFVPLFPCSPGGGLPAGHPAECAARMGDGWFAERASR